LVNFGNELLIVLEWQQEFLKKYWTFLIIDAMVW